MQIHHTPVLLDFLGKEILRETDKFIVDLTLGEGGHSAFFLRAGCRVLAVDRDERILAKARERLAAFSGQLSTWCGNYADAGALFERHSGEYDLVLMDLGISMYHYRESGRGFSFQAEEPLDMRLSEGGALTAAEIVNSWREDELADLFFRLGGEKKSRPMARRIVQERSRRPIESAKALADLLKPFAPPPRHGEKHAHGATRVFQALRIAVNGELEHIEAGIRGAAAHLKPHGRIAVITYHSLEDRLVKETFKSFTGVKVHVNRYREASVRTGWRLLFDKPVTASPDETRSNPAARSAKLRVLIRDDRASSD